MFRREDSVEALSLVRAIQKRDYFGLASMETHSQKWGAEFSYSRVGLPPDRIQSFFRCDRI